MKKKIVMVSRTRTGDRVVVHTLTRQQARSTRPIPFTPAPRTLAGRIWNSLVG